MSIMWVAAVSATFSPPAGCPNRSSSCHLKEKKQGWLCVGVCGGGGMGKKAAFHCFLSSQMERGIWPNDFIPKNFTSQHLSWLIAAISQQQSRERAFILVCSPFQSILELGLQFDTLDKTHTYGWEHSVSDGSVPLGI